jgi:hypothetical protein
VVLASAPIAQDMKTRNSLQCQKSLEKVISIRDRHDNDCFLRFMPLSRFLKQERPTSIVKCATSSNTVEQTSVHTQTPRQVVMIQIQPQPSSVDVLRRNERQIDATYSSSSRSSDTTTRTFADLAFQLCVLLQQAVIFFLDAHQCGFVVLQCIPTHGFRRCLSWWWR